MTDYSFTARATDSLGRVALSPQTVRVGTVVSLLHFAGANGSTTFTDATGKAWPRSGNAQISTTDGDFPAGAGLFDGSGDYLTGPNSADWALGNGDFTIACWVKHVAAAGGGSNNDKVIIGRFGAPALVAFLTNNNLAPAFWDGTTQHTSMVVVPANTKTWVSWSRVNGVLHIHTGGVRGYRAPCNVNFTDTLGRYIGGNVSNRFFNGRIQELIVVKGAGLYTSDYTPPTANFPNP